MTTQWSLPLSRPLVLRRGGCLWTLAAAGEVLATPACGPDDDEEAEEAAALLRRAALTGADRDRAAATDRIETVLRTRRLM
jgi:hypothetical protein